jgi:hypothetical protein
MPDKLTKTLTSQAQSATPAVEQPVAAITEPKVEATVPASTPPEPVAPLQVENKPKGKDAAARINELTAKYKFAADEVQQLKDENQRLKSAPNAGGLDVAAPVARPDNPYAPIGTGTGGEVIDEDLEGLPPAIRKMYDEFQEGKRDKAKTDAQSALEQSIESNFKAYPELEGVVDDSEIALEMSKRRLPMHNSDLVFAGRTVGVLRSQVKDLATENAALKLELHKDTVASPPSGNLLPAPPDTTGKVWAPGEKMAEAKRLAAKG